MKKDKNIKNHKDPILEQLGQAIRRERKSRSLSQTELGDLAGASINFVSQVESGKPTAHIGKVIALLQVLGLELKLSRGKSGLSFES